MAECGAGAQEGPAGWDLSALVLTWPPHCAGGCPLCSQGLLSTARGHSAEGLRGHFFSLHPFSSSLKGHVRLGQGLGRTDQKAVGHCPGYRGSLVPCDGGLLILKLEGRQRQSREVAQAAEQNAGGQGTPLIPSPRGTKQGSDLVTRKIE